MKVEVVPVRGVDVVAQVEPRIGERQLHVRHPARDPARGAVVRADRPLRLGRQAVRVQPQAREPGLGESVVVVARHQHHGTAGQRAAELARTAGRATSSDVGERALAQLDHVAEQDDPVGAVERFDERLAFLPSRATSVPARPPRCRSETTAVRIGGMVSGR